MALSQKVAIYSTDFASAHQKRFDNLGGTSLSKVWHLIEQFSEDIDLAVDCSLFGFEGDLTKKQIKKLRKASALFVKDTFCPALQKTIVQYGLQDLCKIWAEPSEYLSPVVMLEIGARSLLEPNEQTYINSMVEGVFPTIQTTIVNSRVANGSCQQDFP